jgi:hypothetical protein
MSLGSVAMHPQIRLPADANTTMGKASPARREKVRYAYGTISLTTKTVNQNLYPFLLMGTVGPPPAVSIYKPARCNCIFSENCGTGEVLTILAYSSVVVAAPAGRL